MMQLHGKLIDVKSLVVDGVDLNDWPDFCDTYFSEGKFTDGSDLNDSELDMLAIEYPEVLWDMTQEMLH